MNRLTDEEIKRLRREIVERGWLEAPDERVIEGEEPSPPPRAPEPVRAPAPPREPVLPPTQAKALATRLLRGRERGAREGKHQSGPSPYGYRRDYTHGASLVIDEHEGEVVRLIFRTYLRVRSMKKLIDFLESQGSRTRRGKGWSRAGVSWILKNDTYVGRVHFGSIKARGHHQPLVSPIIFNKAQKLIRMNDKRALRRLRAFDPPGEPHPHGGVSVCWCNEPGFGRPLEPSTPAPPPVG